MPRGKWKDKQPSGSKPKPERQIFPPKPGEEATGFVVSETLQIQEFLGRTGPYVWVAPGKASLHLEAIVRPSLAAEVRKLIELAKRQKTSVTTRNVPLLADRAWKAVRIQVIPRRKGPSGRASYLVLLNETKPRVKQNVRVQDTAKIEKPEPSDLARRKRTLAGTKVTNAEPEASNAELGAANDELRAALTAKAQVEKQLRESECKIHALLETAAHGVLAVEADGRIGLVNATAEEMFGYSREELLGLPIEELVPSRFRDIHREHRNKYFQQPRSRPMGEGLDLLARRKDGTTFPVEISLSHIEPGDGAVAVAFVSDITERRQAEAQTRLQSEITENMAEGVSMVESHGATIVYTNRTFERLFGYAPGELLGRPVTILSAGTRKEQEATARTIIDALKRSGRWRGEVHNVKKDGAFFWCDYSLFALKHPKHGPVWVGICSDVTERKAADHALRRSQQELRSLTARLISLQEEQYKHLSRELHDAFGQKLAALGMELTALEGRPPARGAPSRQRLRGIAEQLASLADDIHRISRRLHPTILDDLGLVAALKNECVAFSRQHGIEVGFDAAEAPERIPEDVKLCLYRVAQESLANIAKHARAQEVRLSLRGSSREVVLTIEDVGDGFDLEEVRGKGGLGLVSMDERVRLVKGNLVIESQPGKGTKIEVRAPLRNTRPGRPKR